MKKHVLLTLTVALILGVSLFLSCKGQRTPANESQDEGQFSKHMDISIALWNIGDGFNNPDLKNDIILSDLLTRFNFSITPVNVTWNDFSEKNRLWAATGQLPDIFNDYLTVAQYKKWAEEGVLKALPQDLSRWPNIKSAVSSPTVAPFFVDGVFYQVPKLDYKDPNDLSINNNVIYRKDWAKQAGWDRSPNSFAEYVQMCKDVMKQHPGIAGLSFEDHGHITNLLLGVYPEGVRHTFWVKENGLWKPAFTTEAFAQAMIQLRTLWTEGIMDRDAAISIRKEGELKFFSGQSFSLSTINIGRLGSNYELFKTANGDISSEESLDFLDIWAAPDGNKYHTVAFPEGGEALISGTVNDEKLERILYILDYMYNDDYLLSCKNGIENIDWKWDNDKVVSLLSPDVTLRSKYVVSTGANFSSLATWGTWLLIGGKTVRNPNPDLGYTTQRNNEWLQYMKTTKKPVEINFQVQLISTPGKDKVGTFDVISDMYTVVMGTGDPVAMWKNVIKSYEARGLTQAVEEVNVETKNLGF